MAMNLTSSFLDSENSLGFKKYSNVLDDFGVTVLVSVVESRIVSKYDSTAIEVTFRGDLYVVCVGR